MKNDNKLQNIAISDLSVTTYCNKIKALSDLLANLDSDSVVP